MKGKEMYQKKIKRFLDIVLCGGAMIFLWPVFLIIAVLIKLDSPGPVYFKQKRVGIHKTHFDIYKFRTMRTDTPKDMPTHLLKDPEAYITRMGKFLRKTSLDELPQILHNVLINGDMSIIGPRPALWNQYDLIEERDKYGANDVKPGISGWAQIHGRDELEILVKAELDGYYAQHLSFWMDVKCLLGTIKSVVKSEGVVEGGTGAMEMAATEEPKQGKKKKVLFVATVVRLHINLFHNPYMKWFQEQGWQVDVAANNDYEDPEDCVIPYCDHFYCLPFERQPLRKGNLRAYFQLKKIIEEGNYDIVHCHTPMGSVIARLAARKMRKRTNLKVMYTAHGFHFFKGSSIVSWLVYYTIERFLSRYTDVLLTMNREDYKRAKTFHARKVKYVPGVGVDLARFKSLESREDIRKQYHIGKEDIFLVSVGQFIKRKNHRVILKAVERLKDKYIKIMICGDGPLREELLEEAEQLGIEEQLILPGFCNNIQEICNAADIFVFPSLQEGLPVALMEAMACGLPVVCSKIRGNVDLIDHKKGGYLVPVSDDKIYVKALSVLIKSKEKRQRMGQYNKNKIQKFSSKVVMDKMAEIYREEM